MTSCPDDDTLIHYEEGALSVEASERLEAHANACAQCTDRQSALRRLIADVKAPIGPELDVRAHVRSVMVALDRAPAAHAPSRPPSWAWAAIGSAAACAAVAVLLVRGPRPGGSWQARGTIWEATVERNVWVQPRTTRASDGALVPLAPGAVIEPGASWTATFRNLGTTQAFLLLFAVDNRNVVHWIAPRYASVADDPASTALPPSLREQVLGTTAVLDDVAPGALRIIAVVSASPAHVSDVEAFEGDAWDDARLRPRLPAGADVRETLVEVSAAGERTR